MFSFWIGSLIMVLMILTLAFVIIRYTIVQYPLSIEDFEMVFALTIIVSAIVFLVIGATGLQSSINKTKVNVSTYETSTNIYSLQDSIGSQGSISGAFVLGFGGVHGDFGSTLYYYTLVGNDNDGYIVKKFESENTYLVPFDSDTQPFYVEIHEKGLHQPERGFIFGKFFNPLKSYPYDDIIKTELHIPRNYIKQEYNVDLQ